MWIADGMVRKGSVVTLVVLAAAVHIYAARPLEVDDADTVEEGRLQIEFGVELETGANTKTLTAPFRLASGLTRWLEVGIEPSVLYSDDQEASPQRAAGAGDLRLGAKGRLPISPHDIDFAHFAAVKIPTADGQPGLGTGQVDMTTRLIATKAFSEEQKPHFNIGYTWVGKVRGEQLRNVLFVGVAGETNIPVEEFDEGPIPSPLIIGARQQDEQRRGVHATIVMAERHLLQDRHLAVAGLM
jgi:hypothetical protein